MDDLISRQAAIDVVDAVWSVTGDKNVAKVWDQIKDLPSAQPVCEDTVYRKAVQMLLAYFVPEERYAEAVDGLRRLPSAQPEPHWIPCSERYPDMDERVLVYTVAHEYHVWDCMSNRADNYFWEDEEGLYHGKYEVDLWMPLPEPYKGGEQDG